MSIKLGDNVFTVPPPGAMKSFAFQQSVLPVAGRIVGVLFHVLGAAPGGNLKSLMGQDVERVLPEAMPLLGEVFAALPNGELDRITRTLLGDTTYTTPSSNVALPLFGKNGVGDPFDGLMIGRTIDTWRLMWHALEVWYPDFFTRGRTLFATATKKESPSEVSAT